MARILIVEDEEAIADLEKDYLENASFDVTIVSDGDKGLEMAKTMSFDLIILDVMLPKIDGFTILKEIRDEQNIPVILVTAKKEDIDKIRGLGLGADDYITKPFSPGELVARVKAHLSRYNSILEERGGSSDIIHIRGIRLDKKARRVFVSGHEIRLTSKEYELLLFFMEHPNEVFTKEDLFREVWKSDYFGDIATVVVHIKKLREKIETDPVNPQYIQTIWGAGYRLRV